MLIALLVCLIPTTIGGLLSAIGISGIDRLIQRNVMATSGRAVEAAGDVDVLLLDKTGTITLGNRMAVGISCPRRRQPEQTWPTPRNSPRWPTKRPKAAASWCWRRKSSACAAEKLHEPHATFVPFTAQTRMSGVDFPAAGWPTGTQHSQRRGRCDARLHVGPTGRRISRRAFSQEQSRKSPARGGTPLVVAEGTAKCSASSSSRTW